MPAGGAFSAQDNQSQGSRVSRQQRRNELKQAVKEHKELRQSIKLKDLIKKKNLDSSQVSEAESSSFIELHKSPEQVKTVEVSKVEEVYEKDVNNSFGEAFKQSEKDDLKRETDFKNAAINIKVEELMPQKAQDASVDKNYDSVKKESQD